MNLCVTVVAAGDAIVCPGGFDLGIFQSTEFQTRLLVSGLQKTTPAAAAIIIGPIRVHLDKILFAHHGFDHKTKILGDGIPVTFANDLTGILNGKFNLQILVPIGIHVELALPDPLRVIFVYVFDFKLMRNVEFFQSCQD